MLAMQLKEDSSTAGSSSTMSSRKASSVSFDDSEKSRFQWTTIQVVLPALCFQVVNKVLEHVVDLSSSLVQVRVADDNWLIDPDFPDIDIHSPLCSLGESKFLICMADTDEVMCKLMVGQTIYTTFSVPSVEVMFCLVPSDEI